MASQAPFTDGARSRHVSRPIAQAGSQPHRYRIGTASAPLYVGGLARLRLYIHVFTAAASALTTITVKVQQRYSQRWPQLVQLGWVDTASQNAAGVSSVEHAFTVATGGTFDFALALDPVGIPDVQLLVKANAQGGPSDTPAVFASPAL
jgi:hypothetical protein